MMIAKALDDCVDTIEVVLLHRSEIAVIEASRFFLGVSDGFDRASSGRSGIADVGSTMRSMMVELLDLI